MRYFALLVVCSGFAWCLAQAGWIRAEETPRESQVAEQSPSAETAEQDAERDLDPARPAGHSLHGEAFNEGPRQRAYLMPGTGPVRFDVTSEKADAQAFIEQGIGQLHGFWYFEAERSFRQAATLDGDCAIAYWGMAMANSGNAKRAKEFLAHAMHLRGLATEREAMYIDALDDQLNGKGDKKEKARRQIAAFEALAERYPDDLEAKAWLGYALYKHRADAGKKYEEIDAALKEVLAVEPLHPVHHYIIHLWDLKDPAKALPSSAVCGQSSPAIAHMWHMPGHIYSRLKRYEDAVWQQEASARTDHAHMMRNGLLPDETHNFAHNNEWLIRNLIYVGRWRDAIELAKNMIELPRHPKYNTLARRRSSYYGRVRLFEVLKRYERWGELIALTSSPYLEPTGDEAEQVRRLQHRGIAFAELHHVGPAEEIIADLNGRLEKARAKAQAEAEKQKKEGKDDKKDDKSKRGDDPAQRLEKAVASIEGRLLVAEGDFAEALPLLKKADEEKFYQARVRLLAGEKEAALKAIADDVKSRENQVHPLAVQVEMLWLAGEQDEAKKAFERLRKLSGSIQPGAAPFERLAPIAAEFGFPADWRIPRTPADDVGERPALDALGPLHWSPSPAADWQLPDHTGKEIALADYRGRPVIAIFYLGHGCLHCAEQLQAFAPMTEKFEKAGISLIAVSTDGAEGLKVSLENYDGGMPFPLVSDEGLEVFKAYRAFDDFEQAPLHGTYLIDGAGRVLWRDIGHEPFMDAKFVLDESQRLLHQAKPLPEAPSQTELVKRKKPKPAVVLADLPRIDPAGIGGSLVLSGSDLPEAAIDSFFRLAHGEAAKVVAVVLDDEAATKAAGEGLLRQWNERGAGELRLVRLGGGAKIAALDWHSLLAEATGVWLAGESENGWQSLVAEGKARSALADFVARGGVVGTAGRGSAMLASAGLADDGSSHAGGNTLALLPDSVVDIQTSSQESPSPLEKSLAARPYLIGYELDAGAALVVRGRRIWKVGEGAVRIYVGGPSDSPAEVALSGGRDAADLTALRRAARERISGNVPPEQPQAAKVESGTLIMVGGGGMPRGIVSRFVELAGGEDARIVVLPTALPDPLPPRDGMAETFRQAGAKTVTVLPGRTLQEVESQEYLDALKQATGIWFGGGRQWRFVDAYLGTNAHELMHDVLRRGGVIMGSSAGASIQAEYLARGNPLGNLDIMADGYQQGLGFLPGAAVDQHFSQRNRQRDMQSLVERHPQLLGIGIDEGTALVVTGEVGEVVGRGAVHFFDGAKPDENASVAAGGRYDLPARKVLPPPDEATADADPRKAKPSPPVPE